MRTLSVHCSYVIYVLQFNLLDQVVEDLRALGKFPLLAASPYEQYNVNIKHAYQKTPARRGTCTGETGRMVECRTEWTQTDLKTLSSEEKERKKSCVRSTAEGWSVFLFVMEKNFLVDYLQRVER